MCAQIMEDLSCVAMRDGKPLEAIITDGLAHPGIVNTLAHTVVLPQGTSRQRVHDSVGSCSSSSSDSGRPSPDSSAFSLSCKTHSQCSSIKKGAEGVAWLLLEFCDKGCLQARTASTPGSLPLCQCSMAYHTGRP